MLNTSSSGFAAAAPRQLATPSFLKDDNTSLDLQRALQENERLKQEILEFKSTSQELHKVRLENERLQKENKQLKTKSFIMKL